MNGGLKRQTAQDSAGARQGRWQTPKRQLGRPRQRSSLPPVARAPKAAFQFFWPAGQAQIQAVCHAARSTYLVHWNSLSATSLKPLRSKREMISPTSPRCTPAGRKWQATRQLSPSVLGTSRRQPWGAALGPACLRATVATRRLGGRGASAQPAPALTNAQAASSPSGLIMTYEISALQLSAARAATGRLAAAWRARARAAGLTLLLKDRARAGTAALKQARAGQRWAAGAAREGSCRACMAAII